MRMTVSLGTIFILLLFSALAFAGIGLTEKEPGRVDYFVKNGTNCATFTSGTIQKIACIRGENLRIEDEDILPEIKKQFERGFWAVFKKAPEKSWFEIHLVLPRTVKVYFTLDQDAHPYAYGEGDSIKAAVTSLIKSTMPIAAERKRV